MHWMIFYGDGSTFCHEDGSPSDAPAYGVICIVQDALRPSQVLHQVDFYWWRDDRWTGGDIFGFIDQAANFGATWVKQGRTIRSDDYQEIMSRAIALKNEWDS